MTNRVIGFDVGISRQNPTAYAVLGNDGRIFAFGLIRVTGAPREVSMRVGVLFAQARDLITKYRPEYAGIELPFVGQNASTALSLGMACGAIMAACSDVVPGVPVVGVKPTEAKLALAGHGGASKEDMIEAVNLILSCDRGNSGNKSNRVSSHEADAVGVAMAARNAMDGDY